MLFSKMFCKLYFVFALFVSGCINVYSSQDLPKYIKKCKKNDPNLNECLLKATESIKPYLIKGIPELKVPTIDPLLIEEVTIEQDANLLNFKALLQNVKVRGLGGYNFSKFDFDVPNLEWFAKATVGPMQFAGDYIADGRVLSVSFKSNGTFTLSIDGAKFSAFHKALSINKKGEEYAKAVKTKVSLDALRPKIYLENLMGDDKESNIFVNRMINENIEFLFESMRGAVEEIAARIFEDALVEALNNRIPLNKLYPSD